MTFGAKTDEHVAHEQLDRFAEACVNLVATADVYSTGVAEDRGVSMAQVALSWVTNRPGVTSTILGARTVDQLEDNLASVDCVLDDEEIAQLDEASDLHATDYPYGALGAGPARPGARRG